MNGSSGTDQLCRIFFIAADGAKKTAVTQPLIRKQTTAKLPVICFSVYGMVKPTDGSNVVCDVINHVILSGGSGVH
jgi:hypothetical protein